MSAVNYKSENADFHAAIAGKTEHVDYELVRYSDGSVDVLTGADIPQQSLPSVNRLQFKLALQVLGMLTSVEAFAASESATAAMKIWWAEAGLFAEDNPMLCEACALMGISNEQKAAVFALARTIPAG